MLRAVTVRGPWLGDAERSNDKDAVIEKSTLSESRPPTIVFVTDRDYLIPLLVSEITWLEAAGNYVRIHTSTANFVTRTPLRALVHRLGTPGIVRVHKSAAVNVLAIEYIERWYSGQRRIKLRDGTHLMLSRSFRKSFEEAIPFFD